MASTVHDKISSNIDSSAVQRNVATAKQET